MTYFPEVSATELNDASAVVLTCARRLLLTLSPSNVAPEATIVRRESSGNDFVIPHSGFDGFGLVVRVGGSPVLAEVAYSGCRRLDRGDEFDAAFDPAREGIVARVELDAGCADLNDVLREYLERRLEVVAELARRTADVVRTRILWPVSDETGKSAAVLWETRELRTRLRATDEHRSFTAFAESAP
jgi:hypothetical protein